MQFEFEMQVPQKQSALNPIALNQLRSQKRNAVHHVKILCSMSTKNNLNKISFQRRNALLNPLKIHFYIMNEIPDTNDSALI